MEGYDFDVTCTFSNDSVGSIEFVLPNGQPARTNSFMSLRRRWKTNSVELKVRNAVKTRDEGIYKCIVKGILVSKALIEFVTEPFLKLSTLKPVLRVFEKEETEIIIDFEALPFPRFYTVLNHNLSKAEILNEKDLVEMEPKQHQISPNQLRTRIHRIYGKRSGCSNSG